MLAINLTKSVFPKPISLFPVTDNSYLHCLSTQLKENDGIWTKISAPHRRTIQKVCLVTTQSFNEGSLDTRKWKRSLSHQLFVDIMFFEDLFKPSIGEKLVAKQEFNNTMDKHAVKVVKHNETVSHFPSKFSQIVWYMYFLAHSGEISVEVIGRRRCGRMEVIWQLEFNLSNEIQMKLLKEARVRFRNVLKILTNGSFRSQQKRWSTTGFIV